MRESQGGGAAVEHVWQKVYEQTVMPLTKEVEVLYLLRRLEGEADGAAVVPAGARGGGGNGARQ
ncbi:hypothetical protein TSOC_008325 [Tetrabaena socialis]|uniref:chorismate mutase n=1 Tax=Tetrabaena socialis TaxID=47790 RepID=A0A2J7ZYS6_9CHLO|nr:hypothetical protein TSOC_008325 [Tetrabaena socialis]|eukprot:PNH05423.1 hypothetical protein TSOC_008325 [Tetrabaena socialis]